MGVKLSVPSTPPSTPSYLRAFRDQVTWADARDAFRTWNIDIGSSFLKQNADDIDPQLLEHVEGILSAIANKARENK
jgi:hypothetical protein